MKKFQVCLVLTGLALAFAAPMFAETMLAETSTDATPVCLAGLLQAQDNVTSAAPEKAAAPEGELPSILDSGDKVDAAVTCGPWKYAGCCVSQTKYKRTCQFSPYDVWTETKCQNNCMM
jgi:hypothetical protein